MAPIRRRITKKQLYQIAEQLRQEAPCVTIGKFAKMINFTWGGARKVLLRLYKYKLIIRIRIVNRDLWCVDVEHAKQAIFEIKHEIWRLLCQTRHRFIKPSAMLKLIRHDIKARKIFSKYIDVDKSTAQTLNFITSVLTDLFGPPIDKTEHRSVYYIPPNFCQNEPTPDHVDLRRYKLPYTQVSFLVPEAMLRDMEKAAAMLKVTVPELVRMAIGRMLREYRHILDA